MSLARTALRLAGIAALNADPVIAALCPDRVFDSRIDLLDAADPVPVIVLLTEDDTGRAWSTNNGGPPFDHACDLQLEISMRVVVPTGDADDVQIGIAETDAEAEATIDLIEERAVDALTVADTPQAALIRSAVTRRATELKSIRYASAESGSKIALRVVTLTVHLKVDQPDPTQTPTGAFAALPEPLRSVAAAQPATSSAYLTCLGIVAKLGVTAPVPLRGMDFTIQPQARFDPRNPPYVGDPFATDPIYVSVDTPCPATSQSENE